MSQAQLRDVESIKGLRVQLAKFVETAQLSLIDADSEVSRTIQWIELEQTPHWATQIRKREEMVSRCKDAMRQKTLYKDSTGGRQSAVDETKALKKAQAALEEAQQKYAACQQLLRRIRRVQMEYRGQTQRLALTVSADLPDAVVRLGNQIDLIEQYTQPTLKTQATSVAISLEELKPTEFTGDTSSAETNLRDGPTDSPKRENQTSDGGD